MAIKFISDLHLGHEKLQKEIRIQFPSIEEMDDYLIDEWNKNVNVFDDVYILGDLIYRAKKGSEYYLERMKGNKHLIVGNHDWKWLRDIGNPDKYFVSIDNMTTINIGNNLITLCHYPMLEWNRSKYAGNQKTSTSWLVHGHLHSAKDETYEYIKEKQPCALNASVEINEYHPVTFEEMVKNNNRWYERDL